MLVRSPGVDPPSVHKDHLGIGESFGQCCDSVENPGERHLRREPLRAVPGVPQHHDLLHLAVHNLVGIKLDANGIPADPVNPGNSVEVEFRCIAEVENIGNYTHTSPPATVRYATQPIPLVVFSRVRGNHCNIVTRCPYPNMDTKPYFVAALHASNGSPHYVRDTAR